MARKRRPPVAAKGGKPLFDVSQEAPNVHTLRFEVGSGWEQWLLLSSDRHHDNKFCDWEFEKRHLELAKQRNAAIIDVGDLFCAMQGKYDPRSSMDALRPEHKRPDYLDAIVETAAEFYKPYARNFVLIGRGNHETNITGRHGTDLTDGLCRMLRQVPGAIVTPGGYGGWVRLMFSESGARQSKTVKYFHGGGGGAIMTSGTLDNRRQASFLPDADIIVNGHTHDQYVLPLQRERLTTGGTIVQDALWCIRTGTYKDEYQTGAGGWHVERRGTPKPIGAVWVHLAYERQSGHPFRIRIEPTLSLRDS
jgi:hypothetical protein